MLTPEGHAKVMDFGLAKQSLQAEELSQEATRSRLTEAGLTVGTLAYMSPEQIRGTCSRPSPDLFSLGVVLYEMLTGATRSRSTWHGHGLRHRARAAGPGFGAPRVRGPEGAAPSRPMLAKRPDDRAPCTTSGPGWRTFFSRLPLNLPRWRGRCSRGRFGSPPGLGSRFRPRS